jgi:hypothetical protein
MLGSAAVDLAWTADASLAASITLGNRSWDTAAGSIIAREAGAHVVDLGGSTHDHLALHHRRRAEPVPRNPRRRTPSRRQHRPHRSANPMLITFEDLPGAGKTTQAALLADCLRHNGPVDITLGWIRALTTLTGPRPTHALWLRIPPPLAAHRAAARAAASPTTAHPPEHQAYLNRVHHAYQLLAEHDPQLTALDVADLDPTTPTKPSTTRCAGTAAPPRSNSPTAPVATTAPATAPSTAVLDQLRHRRKPC